jgi:two-component system response regulator RegA
MTQPNTATLLIVEDDEALRNRLVPAMEKRGFNAHAAASVQEALAFVDQTPPDFAIVDLRLLDGSGLDVVKALEVRKPQARSVILTGYGDIPTAVSAARLGAFDYIAKPAAADEIVDVLMAPEGENPPAPENPIEPDDARMAHIEGVYERAGRNVSKTARLLNMHRRTLQRLLRKHGLTTAN